METRLNRFKLFFSRPPATPKLDRTSWSIWLYKDIGFQGMLYTDPEGPYMKLLAPFLAKKKRFASELFLSPSFFLRSRLGANPTRPFLSRQMGSRRRPDPARQSIYPLSFVASPSVLTSCLLPSSSDLPIRRGLDLKGGPSHYGEVSARKFSSSLDYLSSFS